MRDVAAAARVAVAKVVVAQDGIVKEALEDDVLVACGTSVVDTTQAVGLARGHCGVHGDV